MRSKLELFVCKCSPCADFLDEIELAARNRHDLEVVHALEAEASDRVRQYRIRLLPSLVIDGEHIVEGRPDDRRRDGDDFILRLRTLAVPLAKRRQA